MAEAKGWLRLPDSYTTEDAMIVGLISAARHYVETFTRRALVTQSFEQTIDNFPGRDFPIFAYNDRMPEIKNFMPFQYQDRRLFNSYREITLLGAPLASVQSVTYYDTDGNLQTFSSPGEAYFVDTRTEPGRIVLNTDYDWPDTQLRPGAVIIAFTAGYGTPSQVPAGIRIAIRMMVTNWFLNRTPVEVGLRAAAIEIPQTAEAMLWHYRLPGTY